MRILRNIFKCIVVLFLISTCNAGKKIKSEYCTPYFVSLKVSKANSHVGPGIHYKNAYQYQVRWTPLLVTKIYDKWRMVTDMNKGEGWLKQSQLSTKRYVMVKKTTCILYAKADTNSKQIAVLKKEVIMKLIHIDNDWCYVIVLVNGKQKHKGYVQRKYLFGILEDEKQL